MMNKWRELFPNQKPIIGMVHVQALPGTPGHHIHVSDIIELAVREAQIYEQHGLDAVMLENMHDVPYLNQNVGPEVTAVMTAIACSIRKAVSFPVGIQVLAAANREALAIALAAGLDFIRIEGFVYGHVADEGYIDSCAGELLRYRKQIGAEHIAIITDIKKKHSAHNITSDVSIGETAAAAEFFLSDGLIVTGTSTGIAVDLNDLKAVREHSGLPVIIGSGITVDNIMGFWEFADAFIIGSYFKEQGLWSNPISPDNCKALMSKVKKDNSRSSSWKLT